MKSTMNEILIYNKNSYTINIFIAWSNLWILWTKGNSCIYEQKDDPYSSVGISSAHRHDHHYHHQHYHHHHRRHCHQGEVKTGKGASWESRTVYEGRSGELMMNSRVYIFDINDVWWYVSYGRVGDDNVFHHQAFMQILIKEHSEYVFYVNSAMDYEGALAFARWEQSTMQKHKGKSVDNFY